MTAVTTIAGGRGPYETTVRVLASSAVSASITGTTNETTLATITIPPLGLNDSLRVSTLWSYTNSGNNKTFRIDLGGTDFMAVVQSSSAVFKDTREIRNVNSQSVQKSWPAAAAGANNTGSAITSGAINTGVSTTLTLTAQLASAGETATLESYLIELITF